MLVLIATLAAFLLWLLGTAAEHGGLHPGNGKRRVYSRLFLARLLLVFESCRVHVDDMTLALGPLDQWVATDYEALLAD